MEKKWRPLILKCIKRKFSGKSIGTTNNKKDFYKVNGKHVEIIENVKMLKRS